MLIKQISVFIENRPGRTAEVAELLGKHNVDITALSLADSTDFGILRLIVDKPDVAHLILHEAGIAAKTTEVLAVAMSDQPGGLASVLRAISNANISIEYMYAFVGKKDGKAVVVLRPSDVDGAVTVLEKDSNALVSARDIYNL